MLNVSSSLGSFTTKAKTIEQQNAIFDAYCERIMRYSPIFNFGFYPSLPVKDAKGKTTHYLLVNGNDELPIPAVGNYVSSIMALEVAATLNAFEEYAPDGALDVYSDVNPDGIRVRFKDQVYSFVPCGMNSQK